MTFYTAISNLYSDDFESMKATLLSAEFVQDLNLFSDYVFHTGFTMSSGVLSTLDLEFLYDTLEHKLVYQCVSQPVIPRNMGLKMFKQVNSGGTYFVPLKLDDGVIKSTHHFYYSLDDDSFTVYINLIHEVKIIYPSAGIEFNIKHGGSSHGINKLLRESIGEKFSFIISLGNETREFKYPYNKFYNHGFSFVGPFTEFFKRCSRKLKVKGDSWNKMAEDELKAWDNESPGWSDGLWD